LANAESSCQRGLSTVNLNQPLREIKMNTYIFTTDRGMEIEIRAWFREQAIKDFVFMWQPETFVRVEKLEN
jgi:phage-related protein